MKKSIVYTSLFLMAAVAALASAASITLQQGTNGYAGCSDTYVVMQTDSTPADHNKLIVEGYHCSACIDERTLIRYDLSMFDKNSGITKAELVMYSTSQPRPGPGTIRAYKISRDWTPAEANWYNATKSVKWTVGGGDFTATPVASLTYASGAVNVWHRLNVTNAVNDFVANPATNFGLMMKLDPVMYTVVYNSSEAVDATLRPKLEVTFSGTPVLPESLKGNRAGAPVISADRSRLRIVFPNTDVHRLHIEQLNGVVLFSGTASSEVFQVRDFSFGAGRFIVATSGREGTFSTAVSLNR